MPKTFLRRSARVAAATAVITLGATGLASAATLESAYDFNQTLEASYFGDDGGGTVSGVGNVYDDSRDGRTVLSFAPAAPDAPAGLSVSDFFDISPTSFSIDLTFALEDTDRLDGEEDWQRVVDFRSGVHDTGLYVKDGNLQWYDPNATTKELSGTTSLPDDMLVQVTLVRSGSQMLVYLNRALEITVTENLPVLDDSEGLGLFADSDQEEQGSGYVARLRLFAGELTQGEIVTLDPLDVTPPSSPQDLFDNYGASIDDGGTRWLGPRPYVSGVVVDDGTAAVAFTSRVLDAADNQVIAPTGGWSMTNVLAIEALQTYVYSEPDLRGLAHNGDYKLETRSVDDAGNARVVTYAFKLDKEAPQLSIDEIGSTTNRRQRVAGKASTGPRDIRRVFAQICKGDSCEEEKEDDYVGYVEADVAGDGRFSGEIKKYDHKTDTESPVELANGLYVISAGQSDEVSNFTPATRTFSVVDAPPAVPVVLPPPAVQPPTVQQLVNRLMQNAVARLARLRLATLVRDGRVTLPGEADRKGRLLYQLFATSAPKKVDPKAKAAQAKKKKAKRKVRTTKNLIAVGSKTFAAAGRANVVVRLTRKGRNRLRGRKSAKLVLRTIFVPAGGKPVSQDAKLTLKR